MNLTAGFVAPNVSRAKAEGGVMPPSFMEAAPREMKSTPSSFDSYLARMREGRQTETSTRETSVDNSSKEPAFEHETNNERATERAHEETRTRPETSANKTEERKADVSDETVVSETNEKTATKKTEAGESKEGGTKTKETKEVTDEKTILAAMKPKVAAKTAETLASLTKDLTAEIEALTKVKRALTKALAETDDKEVKESLETVDELLTQLESLLQTITQGASAKEESNIAMHMPLADEDAIKNAADTLDAAKNDIARVIDALKEKGTHEGMNKELKEALDGLEKKTFGEDLMKKEKAQGEGTEDRIEKKISKAYQKHERHGRAEQHTARQGVQTSEPTKVTVTNVKSAGKSATATDRVDVPVTTPKAFSAQPQKVVSSNPIARFQEILPKIVKQASVMLHEGKSEMELSLKPDFLGKVKMKVTLEGDTLTGKIVVDNQMVKDLFDRNMDSVIQSLGELGININGFDVSLKQDSGSAQGDENEDGGHNVKGTSARKEGESEGETQTYDIHERRLDITI